MIIVGLQTLVYVVNLVWASSSEADWPEGVVLVGSGGHCRQPERSAKVHTLDDGLINAAVRSIKACLGCLPLGIHLVGDLVRRRLQAVILRRKSWAEKKMDQQAREARMVKPNEDIKPVMASQNCFRWSSHSA